MNFIRLTCLLLNFFATFHLYSSAPSPEATCLRNNTISKKVIIVGAGPAGIAAASRLCENGITDVLILEAEDRVGGRVYTLDEPGVDNVLEIGAQWVHGEKGNVVYELAFGRDLLFPSKQSSYKMLFVQSNTQTVDTKLSQEMWELYSNIDQTTHVNVSEYKTLGNYLLTKINSALQQTNISINKDLESQFIEYFHQMCNSGEGSDTWFQSAASTLNEYQECEGLSAIAWKKKGYRQILSILSEKADSKLGKKLIENYIKKQTEVVKIIPEGNRVRVKCDNGEEYVADHVIVTVSLGVMKANYEKLFPKNLLSSKTQNAIKYLSFGSVAKLYLKFPHKWWFDGDNTSTISLLWNQSDRLDYEKQGLKWLTDVFTFMVVDNHDTMLCGWVCGQSARDMEAMDENLVKKLLMQVLRKFLGNKYNIPEPDWFYRSTWKSNPHFHGTYSFRGISSDFMNVSAVDLSIPVLNRNNDPVILFAGEATHPHYYSTVHGAVETGWREADRLISLKKSSK